MDELILRAEPRTVLGKKVKRLRRDGQVPGVVYGPVVSETVAVTVDRKAFDQFYQVNGHATLFTLQWDGGEQAVFIREVQQDPIKRAPVHIDFFAPNLRKVLRTMVPLALHHHSEDAEGVLTQLRTEIEVEGLPRDIPHQIDVDLSGLMAVGDAIRISDIVVPAGITTTGDPDEVLLSVAAEAVVEEPEVTEVEEGAEGEAEQTESGDATGGDDSAATADDASGS